MDTFEPDSYDVTLQGETEDFLRLCETSFVRKHSSAPERCTYITALFENFVWNFHLIGALRFT